MNVMALEAVLLFILSVPLVMQYRILPVEGTPYWLFGIIFAVLTFNVIFSVYPPRWKEALLERVKGIVFWATLLFVLGGITVTAIVDRHRTAPIYGVHDIVLQQEAAMRFMLVGKNPYKETYFETPMKDWHYGELGRDTTNPALYHFVMPPWYLLFPFLFYFTATPIFGYFDGRMVLLFCLFGTILVILRWFRSPEIGRITAALLALSPGVASYFIEGRSDAFALFWFIWAIYLLDKKLWFWSAVLFGLSLISKQTIWFSLPFYVLYMYRSSKKSLTAVVKYGVLAVMTVMIFVVPFLIWDARAFVESVLLFLSGGTSTGYPVSGYGLGMVLFSLGIIRDTHAYYPFVYWQLAFGLPTMLISLRFLSKKLLISRLFIAYAVTLLVVWYVSRYFNNSHVTYIGTLLLLGGMKDWDERLYEQA